MIHDVDPIARAEHTSHQWLVAVGEGLGTQDRHDSYRVLRAWLHALRDQLTVEQAARLAGDLPELLRGTYFEGWEPSRVPVRHDVAEFAARFAREADIRASDVPAVVTAVSAAARRLRPRGELKALLAVVPAELTGGTVWDDDERHGEPSADARLRALERSVEVLTNAVRALARGLEETPVDEPLGNRAARAGREAHQILLARDNR